MDDSIRLQKLTITLHKISGGQPLGSLFHLRIREGQPNLTDFTCCKKAFDDLNICAKKSNILHSCLQGFRRTGPHPGAFDINSYKVLVGKHFAQPDGIFTPSATKFEHYRMIVSEKFLMPFSLHVKRHIIHRRIRIFEYMRVTRHIGKLL